MPKKTPEGLGVTDQRILMQRYLAGDISRKDLDAYLATLPDVSEMAQALTVPWEERPRPTTDATSDGD